MPGTRTTPRCGIPSRRSWLGWPGTPSWRRGPAPDYGGAMDHESAQAWLDRYVAAWLTYDRSDIESLFTQDIAYRYHPNDDPVSGRDVVVASWLGEDDSGGDSGE